MKRFWTSLATFSLATWIGRHPVTAGVLTLLGVGGGAGIANLITPTILPQPSAYLNQNASAGVTNNGLSFVDNAGVDGPMVLPPTSTNSAGIYIEMTTDSALGYGTGNEAPFSGFQLTQNTIPGLPSFWFQRGLGGVFGSQEPQWWLSPGAAPTSSMAATTGSNYNSGFYPFTAMGGGCAVEPSGVWEGGTNKAQVTSPGFGCTSAPTILAANIPGDGAKQNAGLNASLPAATCATGPTSGEVTITVQVPVAHGVTPGLTYALGGFASPFATTYTALPGTTGTTLVGEALINSGTCSGFTDNSAGTALSGTGATLTMPAISITAPFVQGNTGITSKNNQHICALVGENGADSAFPGAAYIHMVDDKGNALNGAPALTPFLNQGSANATGYITTQAQTIAITAVLSITAGSSGTMTTSTSVTLPAGAIVVSAAAGFPTSVIVNTTATGTSFSVNSNGSFTSTNAGATAEIPALTITSVTSYSVSGATFTGGANATVAFTTSTNPNFVPGTEFTVTGVSPSGYNQTYVTLSETGSGPFSITANPLSGPAGTLQTISNPGAYSSGGSIGVVILPGMNVLGEQVTNFVSPYGTFGSTGTGGVGTYGLAAPQALGSFSFPGSIAGTTLTLGTYPTNTPLVVPGDNLVSYTGTGFSTTHVVALLTGSGGTGSTYQVDVSQTATGGSFTADGTIGTSGTPVNIFFYHGFYNTAVPSTNPSGGTVTNIPHTTFGDFISLLGSGTTLIGGNRTAWGGTLGNVAMLYGPFPQSATGGAPSTTALASLCKKTTDLQTFASNNGLTVHSLFRLNDLGIFGDSGHATITGYIDSATGTSGGTATLHVLSTAYGSLALPTGTLTAFLTAPGLAGVPSASPTIPLTTSAGSSYTVTFASGVISANLGSSGSPVTFSVGAYKPLGPLASNNFTGYIDNGGGSTPTLHITGLPTTPTNAGANFTGSLGTQFTGSISGNTLTISATLPVSAVAAYTVAGIGMTVVVPGGTNAHITAQLTSTVGNGILGQTGTYTIDGSPQTVGSETMFGQNPGGSLPGPATALFNVTGLTGSIQNGQYLTDGGANITGQPLLVTAGSGTTWTVAPNYYPSFTADAALVSSLSTIVPGEYIQCPTCTSATGLISTPVKAIGYGTGKGGLGTYILSASPNSTGLVGSSGSPVTLTGTSITDGGAIAPGPALTIKDNGPGVNYPINSSTISCSGFGSCAGTGTLFLNGTYDTSVLGGTPAPAIQAQVSLSAGGPPVPGCSACAWTNLASYSATLSSGTVFNWSGQALSIPGGGPYFVSVRAANGTAYATLTNTIVVGLPFGYYGQGQAAMTAAQSGFSWAYFTGNWGLVGQTSPFTASQTESYLIGPPVTGDFTVAASLSNAGDRFSVTGNGIPLSEGAGTFDQLLYNAFGWPATLIPYPRDGIGNLLQTIGGVTQTQTIGVGNASTTSWCSQTKFCATAGQGGPLTFSAATQTGAQFLGSISGTTLTVASSMISGAMEPGMVLSGAGITGSPTLVACTANCGTTSAISGPNSQWRVSASLGTISSEAMRTDYPQAGGTPWPTFNFQLSGALPFNTAGFPTLIKAETFQVSVNGTVVCTDTQTFAYNNTGGNCTDSGGGVVSSSGTFVNYQTGDYQITFNTAPASNAAIVASWTNIISPENNSGQFNRPPGFDFFGDGTPQGGFVSGMFAKTPGGAGQIDSGCSTDEGYILQTASPTNNGYQFGAPGYSTETSWLYGTRFPNTIPGFRTSLPVVVSLQFRDEGPVFFNSNNNVGKLNICDQFGQDFSTKSTFNGTISGSVLTLTSNAVGPMWEGEVIGINGVQSPAGIFITGLASGAWGVSGSTYNISNPNSVSIGTSTAMFNDVYFKGSNPVINAGPLYDITVQNQGLSGTTGNNPHMWQGPAGGRRAAARLAATIWGGLTNPANASPPSVDRVKADAGGCDTAALATPCFDIGNMYAAGATATWSGSIATVSGGLSAHARPFVVGQAVSCSGCNSSLYITSVSAPPTQSTVSGQGQVGNTFTFTTNSAIGGTGSGTIAAGCSGTSGTGSNCIDIAFSINTTSGTFGTAASLATCGANNLNGDAPNYSAPSGTCSDNGIGELTRGFRIGTQQNMYTNPFPNGSVFDDGADMWGGAFTRSSAYTCNIVAAKVVQCVLGPAYSNSTGLSSGIGEWLSGSTFVSYGDMTIVSGRVASLLGYVGGQSFPISSAGSGYANGFYTAVQATCATLASGGHAPYFDIVVSGGVITSVVPSATSAALATQAPGLGVGSACTLTDTNFSTAMKNGGAGSGGSISIPLAPPEGTGGIATINTDSNTMGMFLYDNTGKPGNPLNGFFGTLNGPTATYFEPGLPVKTFGEFRAAAVSG